MAELEGSIQQINKPAQWFVDNAGKTLLDGQHAYLNDNSGDFKKGDGTTTIGALPWIQNGGAVDSVNGQTGAVVLTTADIADSSNKRYITDAQQAVIQNTSGTNTGDQTNITGNSGTATQLQTARSIDGQSFNGTANITVIAPGTNAATSKSTPIDADQIPLVDSAASNTLKKLTWANLKTTLSSLFATIAALNSKGQVSMMWNTTSPLDSTQYWLSTSPLAAATSSTTNSRPLAPVTGTIYAAYISARHNTAESGEAVTFWVSVAGGADQVISNSFVFGNRQQFVTGLSIAVTAADLLNISFQGNWATNPTNTAGAVILLIQ